MERQSGSASHPTNSIATQTYETAILGQGWHPLTQKQRFSPFADIDYENSPDYLELLYEVFGENFIAEAMRSEPQSKSLLQIVE